MARRLTITALLVVGFAILSPLSASADDCSSPSDCSNTAWTVGGGAAVAAGLIAAAAASGMLPASPTSSGGGPLSPECQQELSRQLDVINDEFEYISELRGALEGAQNRIRQRGDQLSEHIGYMSTLGDMNPQGPSVPFADMGAGLASAHGASAQTAQRAAQRTATNAMRARASRQSFAELNRAAARAAQPLAARSATASTQEVRAIIESMEATAQRLAAEEARLAQTAHTASSAAARASGTVTRTSYLGAAGGFLSAAINGVSMWVFSAGQAEQMARGKALARKADLEAEIARWRIYAAQLERRIVSRLDHLHSKITKYDSLTYGCGANPIGGSAHQIYADAVANATPGASSKPLPPRLVEPRKRELEEAEKPANCGAYASSVAQYERLLKSTNSDLKRWIQRRDDLATTIRALDNVIEEESSSRWWTNAKYYTAQGSAATISAGGAVAGLVTVVNLPAALALGCLSVVLSVGSDYAYSSTFHQLIESRLRAERAFLVSRSAYIEAEVTRLQSLWDNDLRNRQAELEDSYRECAGEPGVRPPTPVDFVPRERNLGRILPLKEIRTWQ